MRAPLRRSSASFPPGRRCGRRRRLTWPTQSGWGRGAWEPLARRVGWCLEVAKTAPGLAPALQHVMRARPRHTAVEPQQKRPRQLPACVCLPLGWQGNHPIGASRAGGRPGGHQGGPHPGHPRHPGGGARRMQPGAPAGAAHARGKPEAGWHALPLSMAGVPACQCLPAASLPNPWQADCCAQWAAHPARQARQPWGGNQVRSQPASQPASRAAPPAGRSRLSWAGSKAWERRPPPACCCLPSR